MVSTSFTHPTADPPSHYPNISEHPHVAPAVHIQPDHGQSANLVLTADTYSPRIHPPPQVCRWTPNVHLRTAAPRSGINIESARYKFHFAVLLRFCAFFFASALAACRLFSL